MPFDRPAAELDEADLERVRANLPRMLTAISIGIDQMRAATYAGITRKVWRRVLAMDRDDARELVEQVERAEAGAEVDAIARVAASDDWRAAAWMAERINPRRWNVRAYEAAQERLDTVMETLRVRVGEEVLEEALIEAESGAKRKAGA